MTNNTTVCDLCPASSPVADKHANGFVTLNVQFAGPTKLKPLLSGSDNFVDFCPHCFESFIAWATGHRAEHAPTPAPVAPAGPVQFVDPNAPPPSHIVLTEPPHAEAPPVSADAPHDTPHDAPAAHEEAHAASPATEPHA